MQAVMSLAEHVFVLARGPHHRARARRPQVAADPAVVEAYLGHGAAAEARGRRAWPLSRCSRCSGLHAGYGETEILRGVDLAVGAGEIVAVLGSNGAGKSTLNRTISGVVRAARGAIRFDGSDDRARDARRRSSRAA